MIGHGDVADALEAVLEDDAPRRRRRLDAEAEEREAGLERDRRTGGPWRAG